MNYQTLQVLKILAGIRIIAFCIFVLTTGFGSCSTEQWRIETHWTDAINYVGYSTYQQLASRTVAIITDADEWWAPFWFDFDGVYWEDDEEC